MLHCFVLLHVPSDVACTRRMYDVDPSFLSPCLHCDGPKCSTSYVEVETPMYLNLINGP
jgi:hypothetical protein